MHTHNEAVAQEQQFNSEILNRIEGGLNTNTTLYHWRELFAGKSSLLAVVGPESSIQASRASEQE